MKESVTNKPFRPANNFVAEVYTDKDETTQKALDLACMRTFLKAELENRFKSLGKNPNYLFKSQI